MLMLIMKVKTVNKYIASVIKTCGHVRYQSCGCKKYGISRKADGALLLMLVQHKVNVPNLNIVEHIKRPKG